MNNFEFYNPARIIFGKDEEKNVGKWVSQYSKNILLHYGGGSIKKNGVYDKVVKSLNDEGVKFTELGGVVPNPRLSLVRDGIEICKHNNIDFILAVGGGSAIDSAKAIAIGLKSDIDVWEYYKDENMEVKDAAPIGVVLTIPATGSESSVSSVITNEDGNFKRGINSTHVIPKFSVLNPEVTYTLPEYQISCGCSDIISHMMERYFTQVDHVDFTDRMIEGAIRTVLYNGPMALKNLKDYNVRAEIMWVGTIAHNNLLSTGRIGDWGSHKIEHELSGIYDIAHGAGLSIITPAWMRYVYKENIDKFVQFAVRVFDVDLAYDDKESIVLEMIERLEDWYKKMNLPIKLSEAGIGDDKFKEMAEKCLVGREFVGNFKKLYIDDVYKIYELAK